MIRPDNCVVKRPDELTALIEMTFSPDYPYFSGHFPNQPLLPGVVQLGIAIEFAREIFSVDTNNAFPVVKFVSPILPNDTVTLCLKLNSDKKNVSFDYFFGALGNGDQNKASTGKIRIL